MNYCNKCKHRGQYLICGNCYQPHLDGKEVGKPDKYEPKREKLKMAILFLQLALPLACYFIGLFIGMKYEKSKIELDEILAEEAVPISHVGYTMEQLGYEK